MPYISEHNRKKLDHCIDAMVDCLTDCHDITNEEFLSIAGDLNYALTRILMGCIGPLSYSKIAVSTGVLENIKQEFYRRVASTYEDKKIVTNGDIREYKKL